MPVLFSYGTLQHDYEQLGGYKWIAVVLASARQAWLYVYAAPAAGGA